MKRASAALLGVALAACGDAGGQASPPLPLDSLAVATAFTTRLPAKDPETQAIVISQAVYAATREENAAGAVILCPQDPAIALTAMHRITHMPINAPLLYLDADGRLSDATMREIRRAAPEGVTQDRNVQAYVVGRVGPDLVRRVEGELGLRVRRFTSEHPAELALELDRWQAAIKADHPDEVVVSALDSPEAIAHGLGAMGWNAHMGKGFAWVYRDSVPDTTRRILERRFGEHGAYVYLTGSSDVISDEVAVELSRYGFVRRVAGDGVPETSVVNAGYKDFGREHSWWIGRSARSFGWGLAQAGHNYLFVSEDDLLGAIPAALLGHMGKHGPMLVVRRNEVPEAVARYLESVRPFASGPAATLRNHGWILGDVSRISWEVQRELHERLAPRRTQASDREGRPLEASFPTGTEKGRPR